METISLVPVFLSSSGARFTLEAFELLWITGEFIRQKFERNESPERGVLRLLDDTHPVAAELIEHAIMRNDIFRQPQAPTLVCPNRRRR